MKVSLTPLVLCAVGCAMDRSAVEAARLLSPAAHAIPLGYSVQGRPIEAFRFGTRGPVALILAGFHGDEQAGVHVARQLAELLAVEPDLCGRWRVVIVANVNPDGFARRARRNARRVDLNRNFPAADWRRGDSPDAPPGGPAPLSEPESAIVRDLVVELKPRFILSVHAITRDRQCNNYDGPAERLAQAMAARNGYPAKASIGYPTPGSFGRWAGAEQGIPTVTLELPARASAEQCWADNRNALLAALR